jgi:hypothetical protein
MMNDDPKYILENGDRFESTSILFATVVVVFLLCAPCTLFWVWVFRG